MAAARVSFSLWASMALARPPALGNSHTGFVRKAAAWCSAPQIRFAPPRSSNWKSGRSATASRSSNRNPAPILQLSFTMRLRCAKARAADVVIVDTAGRLHTKSNLMAELDKMKRTAAKVIPGAPHDVLLVLDATTGQNGLAQAREFTSTVGVTGIILTKLDGTAKGGIVVDISRELGLPIRFVGTGEQLNDMVPFDAETYANSLFD